MDGCGAQNKGVNVLPSRNGPVILATALGYRTSPSDYITKGTPYNLGAHVWHADNQQAAASTYLFPLEFNPDHTLKNWTCPSRIQVPLANTVEEQPQDPIPYQLDCRIRNWQNVYATFHPAREMSKLEIPIWQRTDNLASTMNAGPVLDGPITITLELVNETRAFSWPASNVSWAPTIVPMDLKGSSIISITLSTNATNGCYGTMAQPKIDKSTSYGTVVKGAQGYRKVSENAQLYVV